MKILKHLTILGIAAMCVLSCTKDIVGDVLSEREQPADGEKVLREVILTATAADAVPDTKTQRGADGSSLWSPGDAINLFYGPSEGCGSRFVAQNDVPVSTTTFRGTIEVVTGTVEGSTDLLFWGTYPYNQANTCEGSSVGVYLPEEQTAVDNSWGEGALASVGRSQGLAMGFYNLVGGIKIYVTEPGIREITFKGKNSESVAGKVKVEMNGSGRPEITQFIDNLKEVTLLPPADRPTAEFTVTTPGDTTWYYFTVPPQNYSQGFTLTLRKADSQGVKSYSARTINRNRFQPYGKAADDGAVWTSIIPNNQIWYTTTTDGTDERQPVSFHPDGVHHTANDIITSEWDSANQRWVMTFPDELTYLDDGAFLMSSTLKTVALPDELEIIGQAAFLGSSNPASNNLTDVHLGSSVKIIRRSAFDLCTALQSINLPEGLQYIDYSAFNHCSSLESITLPSTLLGIGVSETSDDEYGMPVAGSHDYSPFAYCDNLTAFYGSGANFSVSADNKYLLSENGTFLIAGAKGALNGGSVNIPNDVTVIGDNALRSINCSLLNIRNNITTIGRYGFADAHYTLVSIGQQVTTIKENAFSNTTTSNWISINGDILPTIEQCPDLGHWSAHPIISCLDVQIKPLPT